MSVSIRSRTTSIRGLARCTPFARRARRRWQRGLPKPFATCNTPTPGDGFPADVLAVDHGRSLARLLGSTAGLLPAYPKLTSAVVLRAFVNLKGMGARASSSARPSIPSIPGLPQERLPQERQGQGGHSGPMASSTTRCAPWPIMVGRTTGTGSCRWPAACETSESHKSLAIRSPGRARQPMAP